MPTLDIISSSLNAPIEWNQFEQLVVDILNADDIPRIRKVGSYKDSGVDAYEMSYYQDGTQLERVVQITSQKSQTAKVANTLQKLQEHSIKPKTIVFVFQHPVSSPIKQKIIEDCTQKGISCDIRDQSYLISQLAKKETGIFPRYFETVKKQISAFFDKPDKLVVTSTRLQRTTLLSIATYVINPHSRMTRGTLFQKTVLAAVVSRGSATVENIISDLSSKDTETIARERVLTALEHLIKYGDCNRKGELYEPTDEIIAKVGQIITSVTKAYDNLINSIFAKCKKENNCDQATLGYIEGNIRQAMLFLLRSYGPIIDEKSIKLDDELTNGIKRCLCNNVPPNIGRCTLLSFCEFVENQENITLLSIWGRTYASLAIKNIDPIGRKWQQSTLSRTIIALDTDVVLTLLLEDLPYHESILKATKAFIDTGVQITISPYVLAEVVVHFERAYITYKRFAGSINQMSPGMAETEILNAVVRGYYYSLRNEENNEWDKYYNGYFDKDKPLDYINFLLKKRINRFSKDPLHTISSEGTADFDELVSFISSKEPERLKSIYRDEKQKKKRVEDDVYMALNLATPETGDTGQTAKGYLVTNDRLFLQMEEHGAWHNRPKIVILTNSFPQLADIVCGSLLDDKQFVELMFDPIISAAAQLAEKEMKVLITAGVDLKNESVSRIEWALGPRLHSVINSFTQSSDPEEKIHKAAYIASEAKRAGLSADTTINDILHKYDDVKKDNEELAQKLKTTEDTLKKVALSLVTSKKSRRRINHVLQEIGLDLLTLEQDE